MRSTRFIPKEQLVDRASFIVNCARGKTALHIGMGGFLDDAEMAEAYRGIDLTKSLHARLAAVASRVDGIDINVKSMEAMSKAVNLADLCAPDGYLILMTPLLDAPLEKYAAGIPGWFRPPEHLHIFSRLGMTGLFEKIGLRPIHFERFEITWARQTARISIGAAEGIAGAVLSVLSKPTYERLRASRKTRCCEMGLYVFRHADRSH